MRLAHFADDGQGDWPPEWIVASPVAKAYDRPTMKCDLCDKSAVVHETTVKNGVQSAVHLCEEHARAAGVALPGQSPPINQLLTQFVIKSTRSSRVSTRTCANCGMRFSDFRNSGVLGCPACYEAFDAQLSPMIERAQNGATSHAGKCPRRGGDSIDRQLEIQRLVKALDEAVAAEQYERAAELRDRLRNMEGRTPGTPSRREA